MIYFHDVSLQNLALHKIGNRAYDEDLYISNNPTEISEDIHSVLLKYFLSSFKSNEYFNFYHESDINLNEAFIYSGKIFENPESLYEQSVNLAKHLYEQSTHPKIKGGEFYTVYFKDCILDGITTDAIGLFKSENKDTFLKVFPTENSFDIESDKGINVNKLDKGCLIFNIEKENGYIVAIVDNTNKNLEAQYWRDDFLHVQPRADEYHQTQNILTLCKNFVTKELPHQFNMSKPDQIALLNKSVEFFKANKEFDIQEFSSEVIGQPEVIESFNRYKQQFQEDQRIEVSSQFSISDQAVKKQSRVFRSVIKLDKNFHIYVHGNRELIEQGEDENGRKFYKIYYDVEH